LFKSVIKKLILDSGKNNKLKKKLFFSKYKTSKKLKYNFPNMLYSSLVRVAYDGFKSFILI
jgi:hypothetical protein